MDGKDKSHFSYLYISKGISLQLLIEDILSENQNNSNEVILNHHG